MELLDYEAMDKGAHPGAFSVYDSEVLMPFVQKIMDNEIYLEVGVDRGKSLSIARMVAGPKVQVYGVDLRPNPNVPNTHFIQGDSKEVAWQWNKTLGMWKISVLFIDGDHSYAGCKADIDGWFPHMKAHGVMAFHDGDESSPGVMQAVSEFVNNYKGDLNFKMYKRTDKNTSMMTIEL